MIRIPEGGRFELRSALTAPSNPDLMQAAILNAGLDGIDNQRDPGQRLDINMYTDGHKVRRCEEAAVEPARRPGALEDSDVARSGMGQEFVASYIRIKQQEWDGYARHLTQWERDTTLDRELASLKGGWGVQRKAV